MQYSNPKIPEGINTSLEHPLKEFFILSLGVFLVLGVALGVLVVSADYVAQRIPFSFEKTLAEKYRDDLPADNEIRRELQTLAERTSAAMELPEGMSIQVHYVDEATVNAYATLGGNVIVYRGLLARLPHENALVMILAHEIAHIKHRHPIRSLGRGVVTGLAFAALFGTGGDDLVAKVLGRSGLLTLLSFSRDQEREADRTGYEAFFELYGHGSGALDLYQVFLENDGQRALTFLSTHPLTESRIDDLEQLADDHGWPSDGLVVQLPKEIGALVESER